MNLGFSLGIIAPATVVFFLAVLGDRFRNACRLMIKYGRDADLSVCEQRCENHLYGHRWTSLSIALLFSIIGLVSSPRLALPFITGGGTSHLVVTWMAIALLIAWFLVLGLMTLMRDASGWERRAVNGIGILSYVIVVITLLGVKQ
jgi:hypothetical protein